MGPQNIRVYSNILLASPSGELFTEISNLNKFCREKNLTQSAMHDILNQNSHHKQHKGWKLLHIDYEEPKELEYFYDLDEINNINLAQITLI
jgi:hypothetical protein